MQKAVVDQKKWRRQRTPVADAVDDKYRSEFQRDRDRILYSLAFRRLAGITQVAAAGEVHLLHDRMSHSLKVSQIGRRLAEKLKSTDALLAKQAFIDQDVVEAAGLAHDLGHPPFGHIGEIALKRLTQDIGGFEGNAQTFRIVTKLAHHRTRTKTPPLGLDLTNATLNAILKYPRPIGTRDTEGSPEDIHWGGPEGKGIYRSEQYIYDRVRKDSGFAEGMRCAEAVLMDMADDLAYVLHDVEDFYRAGLIPLHELYKHPVSGEDFKSFAHRKVVDKLARDKAPNKKRLREFNGDVFEPAYKLFLECIGQFEQPFMGSRVDEDNLQQLTSGILSQVTEDIHLAASEDEPPRVTVDRTSRCLVAIIRELTWFYVIKRPSLAVLQYGYTEVINTVFNSLVKLIEKHDYRSEVPATVLAEPLGIPTQLKAIIALQLEDSGAKEEEEIHRQNGHRDYFQRRAVADFICTLTESQVIDLHQRFTGQTQRSVFGAWFE